MTILKPRPEGYPIKLVRDFTPEIINNTGEPGELFYAEPPKELVIPFLKRKLSEEVTEYLIDGGVDELSDILAVVVALAREHGVNDLDRVMRDDPRGGFYRPVMMLGRHKEFDLQ